MATLIHTLPEINPTHSYTVSITNLRIRMPWQAAGFFRGIRPVLTQIDDAEGLAAYGIHTRRLDFWTYAAFGNRAAFERFITSAPHGDLMRRFAGRLGPLQTECIQLTGEQLPRTWNTVTRLLTDLRPTNDKRLGPVL